MDIWPWRGVSYKSLKRDLAALVQAEKKRWEGECVEREGWSLKIDLMVDVIIQEVTLLVKCFVCLEALGGSDVIYHRTCRLSDASPPPSSLRRS